MDRIRQDTYIISYEEIKEKFDLEGEILEGQISHGEKSLSYNGVLILRCNDEKRFVKC